MVLSGVFSKKNPFSWVEEYEMVGSRTSCNPPPTDTDEDVLVLVLPENSATFLSEMKEVGYVVESKYLDPHTLKTSGLITSQFISLRMDTSNVIVTSNKKWYDKFIMANDVCKAVNLLVKKDRIKVFSTILESEINGPLAD